MTNIYVFGSFCLCQSSRTLKYNGIDISLGSRAFDILTALVGANGHVLTPRELMAVAWPNSVVEASNVRVQVAHIRRALEGGCAGKRYIASVAGRGYCFVEPVERIASVSAQKPASSDADEFFQTSLVDKARSQAKPQIKLPAPLKAVVGRHNCITELSELVLSKALVTLVGPAGAGKTTLAVLVAHSVQKHFDNTAFFVDLSTVNCLETAEVALALAVGYKTSGTDLLPGLLEFLSTKRALLLFDNCEHVLAAVTTLCTQIMANTGNITLLTTSREALRVDSEFVYMVRPLSIPPQTAALTAQQAMLWPAIELFMLRAYEGGAKSILADDDVTCVTGICRRLDGNPHAIGLVASRVATYGLQGLADLLSNQFALHWQGRRDVCPRQQTVEAMIGWSHNLLTGRDQQVLYRLAVFCGEFPLEAAIAVAADDEFDAFAVSEAIANLADKSLVTVSFIHEHTHIRLFETTKAYALVRLSRYQNKDQVALRHALYYAEQLRHFVDGQENMGQDISDALCSWPEIGNVRAALEWSYAGRQDLSLAADISSMAAPLFLELSLLRESKRCCERALNLLPESRKATKTELCLLASLAVTYYSSGDYDGNMTAVVEQGLKLSRYLRDTKAMFHFLAGLHLAMMANGRFHESLSVSEQYANEVLQFGEHTEAIIAKWMAGSSRHFLGQQAAADEDFSESTALATRQPLRALGYFETKQKTVANLAKARCSWMMGKQQAIQMALYAIDDSRLHPDSFYLCVTLCFPILLSGNLQELAERLIKEMDNAASDYKMAVRHVVIHFLNGLLLLSQGKTQCAEFHLQHCVDMLPPPKMSVVRVDALQALAEAQKENGNLKHALTAINEAIELAEKTGGTYNLADLLRTKAEVLMCEQEPDKAKVQSTLLLALECAQEQAAQGWEQKIRFTMFRLNAPVKNKKHR
ncbi:winged helix-turn-helix domain-containing protein [Chromatiaceae bacterium AAb-1]|nr:winged helix-turn-helix domain-containing protein [Chromatiaceae bacterium AAb-1]